MPNPVQAIVDRKAPLSEMALTCLAHCPDPEMVEQIGRIFIQTAREMRGVMAGGMGNA